MDVERTMEFILEQQAQFAEQMLKLTEREETTEKQLSNLAQHQLTLQQAILDVATAQERTNEILATLAERQVITEANLNALLLTVERHIAKHNYS